MQYRKTGKKKVKIIVPENIKNMVREKMIGLVTKDLRPLNIFEGTGWKDMADLLLKIGGSNLVAAFKDDPGKILQYQNHVIVKKLCFFISGDISCTSHNIQTLLK